MRAGAGLPGVNAEIDALRGYLRDFAACWTQGPIADRSQEVLDRSGKGIILFRHMLEENIRIAQDGGDPLNTFRDPGQSVYLDMRIEDNRVAV